MVGQPHNKEKLADILLVYGYDESYGSPMYSNKFHRKVVEDLKKSNLSNVRIVEYKGKVIDYDPDDELHFSFNKFAEKFLPFDYAINLRDNIGSFSDEKYNPCIHISRQSRISLDKKLKSDLHDYARNITKKAKGKSPIILTDSYTGRDDEPKDWVYIDIQLYPKYVTRKEAFDQVIGLVSILKKYPLDRTDHHLS